MYFDNVLFDLDGTLTDSGSGIIKSVRYAIKKYGLEEPDQKVLRTFVGPTLEESFKKYYGIERDDFLPILNYYREYYNAKGMFENAVYPGIKELLKNLGASGRKCFVATTKPVRPTREVLDHFELTQYFTDIGAPEDDLLTSGDKDVIIRNLLKKNGILQKNAAVMIGDRGRDAEGAKTNGISFAGVLYGYGTREELTDAGSDYILETVRDLSNFLMQAG